MLQDAASSATQQHEQTSCPGDFKSSPSQLLTIAEIAQIAPGNPSANSVWRWARRGVRARNGVCVRLEHVRVGARIFVSREALQRFMSELAAADLEHFATRPTGDDPFVTLKQPECRSAGQRERLMAVCESALTAVGI